MSQTERASIAYRWRDAHERIVRIGTPGDRAILLLAPLLEEANRTRHFLIEAMRGLARRGFCCFLPDLPGTLESTTPLDAAHWSDWRAAAAAAGTSIGQPYHVVSIRGGALLDSATDAVSRWRLTPARGDALLRELLRVRMAADREAGRNASTAQLEAEALSRPFEVAGHRFSPALLSGMKAATPVDEGAIRTLRLDGDALPADARLAGIPLWRRSEPDHDPVLCQSVTEDIEHWIEACGRR